MVGPEPYSLVACVAGELDRGVNEQGSQDLPPPVRMLEQEAQHGRGVVITRNAEHASHDGSPTAPR
jgi:hypothetical protein